MEWLKKHWDKIILISGLIVGGYLMLKGMGVVK